MMWRNETNDECIQAMPTNAFSRCAVFLAAAHVSPFTGFSGLLTKEH